MTSNLNRFIWSDDDVILLKKKPAKKKAAKKTAKVKRVTPSAKLIGGSGGN